MKISVSNSCFVGDLFPEMAKLPLDYGIEIQVEYGTDYYWKTTLAQVMKNRTGALSIHGQFVNVDLAAKDIDEQEIMDYYKWAFDLYNRHGAEHFTLHPDGKIVAPATEQEVADMRARALDRIAKLAEMAKRENVHMLIENLRPKGYGLVFDTDAFIDLFRQIPDVDCLIDTGHVYLSGWDFNYVLSKLGTRIKAYHMNDTFGILDEHQPVGRGCIDWASFFDDYKKYTPDAEFVLEYKGTSVDDIVANARVIEALMR